MQYKNLEKIPFLQIHQAFTDAFSNYEIPFNLSPEELNYMLLRRGYQPKYSYGAFVDQQLTGFVLNGIGPWTHGQTAYDTGTGIIQAYQGKGIGSQLLDFTIEQLKKEGIDHYLLEVIKTNKNALNLYKKKGFLISNTFDYYVWDRSQLAEMAPKPLSNIKFEK